MNPIPRLTHALRNPDTAAAAADMLRGAGGKAEIEGLVELLCDSPSAKAAAAAISALDGCNDPIALDALLTALESSHPSVRLLAVQTLHRRRAGRGADAFVRLLNEDASWPVRRAAVLAVADRGDARRWRVLDAVSDPHWRVRHTLIGVLLQWGETEDEIRGIEERLGRGAADVRVRALRAYLRFRRTGRSECIPDDREPDAVTRAWPFWDGDAAVLARNLERLGDAGRRRHIDAMPDLLGRADERVRGWAAESLQHWGGPAHIAQALALLDEPRIGAAASVTRLLGRMDVERIEAAARLLLHLPASSPAQLAWALDQVGAAVRFEDEATALSPLYPPKPARPPQVRRALARLAGRWPHPEAESRLLGFLEDADPGVQVESLRGLGRKVVVVDEDRLRRLLLSEAAPVRAEAAAVWVGQASGRSLPDALAHDPDWTVRLRLAEGLARRNGAEDAAFLALLRADSHPLVRAAALTPSAAAELIADPGRETSWHVVAEAARKARAPLWRFEPEKPWRPERPPHAAAAEPRLNRPAPPHARLIGPAGLTVAPLGLSGHYGLPVEGFVRAAEAGVGLLFWEPNYHSMTEFMRRLPPAERNTFHITAGTFEADGERVRRDAERALRLLKIDRLAVFLVFWVQSWARVAPDVREALERLKETGKVASFGLSTHSRQLAVEAMRAGWNPVMVRHSAAHRGAEAEVFPLAVELGTSILTFNNTCYGRLLKPHGESDALAAADCYRYTLSTPGVTACWSAPATMEQLEENLAALHDPELPADRRQCLLAHGDHVYKEDSVFRELVRSR